MTIDHQKTYNPSEALAYLRENNGVSRPNFYKIHVKRMAFFHTSPQKRFITGVDLEFYSELLKKNINTAQKYQRTA